MKKIIYLFLFITIHATVFCQSRLRDGIYLIDQPNNKRVTSYAHTMAIQFNSFFVVEDPGEYDPIMIVTDDFVPFELATAPKIEFRKDKENLLFVHLTENATKALMEFTTRNLMKNIVVVVDGEALSIYKVTHPVASNIINISKCSKYGCDQVYKRLKSKIKI